MTTRNGEELEGGESSQKKNEEGPRRHQMRRCGGRGRIGGCAEEGAVKGYGDMTRLEILGGTRAAEGGVDANKSVYDSEGRGR
jgi:hypothetical protein